MKKVFMRMTVFLLLLVFCSASFPGYGVVEGTSSEAAISYMPPNPEVYPEFYEKDRDGSGGMRASASYKAPRIERAGEADSIPEAGAVEKVLVIPISFTDTDFDPGHDDEYFDGILQDMKDYFEVNSRYEAGIAGMSVDATVVEAVYSDFDMAYYGEDLVDIDDANGNISKLAREAVQKLEARGFDFAPYDTDDDDVIDHLFIIHAGKGQEEDPDPDLIWSHRWVIDGDGEDVDGVKALNYVMVPETGQLGTFAHEFGHDIGLPDLYDTNGITSGITEGVGDWDLMGSGSWNHKEGQPAGTCPANLSAWSRMYLGWIEPQEITENTDAEIYNQEGISDVIKFWTAGDESGNEYYLSEYRRRLGYDEGLPGEGMLIWHIDQQQIDAVIGDNTVNADKGRLGVELEQADGDWDLWEANNLGDDGDPFPGSSWNAVFSAVPYRFNYSNLDGSFNYVSVTDIACNGSTASAYYIIEPEIPDTPRVYLPDIGSNTVKRPTFIWDVSPQAEYYILEISDSGDSEEYRYILADEADGIEYMGDAIAFTIPDVDELEIDTRYNWRLEAVNGLVGEDPVYDAGYFYTVAEGMNTWEERSTMPAPREKLAAVELDGKIYVIGGTDENGVSSKLEVYDPATDSWTALADMQGIGILAKTELGAAAVNGKIYAIGGSNSGVYEYDPDTDTWTAKAPMPEALKGFGTAVLNDKIYVVGGIDWGGIDDFLSDQLLIYDPAADSWETREYEEGAFTPRAYLGAAAVGGKLYAIGGRRSDDGYYDDNEYEDLSIVEVYDPETDTWDVRDDMNMYISGFGTTVLDNKIYVLGGVSDSEEFHSTVYEYNPGDDGNDYWVEKASMLTERGFLAAAAAGGEIYAIGGSRLKGGAYPYIRAVEAYDPELSPPNVSFRFDGVNAGRLMGITPEMEYSINGAAYISAVENDQLLTDAELASLTEDSEIRIRVKAAGGNPAGVRKLITIYAGHPVSRPRANDDRNTLTGMDNHMEFSIDGTNWVMYDNNLPDLTGNITIYVRNAAYGTHLPGPISTFVFTASAAGGSGSSGSGRSGGGGGGGGGSAATVTDTALLYEVDAAVVVRRSDVNAYIKNDQYKNVIVNIPPKASIQSAAIESNVFDLLAQNGKGLVINGNNLTLLLSADILRDEHKKEAGTGTYFKVVAVPLIEQEIKDKAEMLKMAGSNGLTLTDRNIFEFNAAIVSGDSQLRVKSFNTPIGITISLKDSKLGSIDTDKLGVYYYNETTKTWDYMGGRYDAAANAISFQTDHFSTFAVMSYEKTFTDINNHWAKTYIEKMASRHIAKGVNGKFEPEASISRAEFTSLLTRALELKGIKEGTTASYTDVAEGKWYETEINKAYSAGIINKEDGVTFRPDIPITREEIAVMLARALQHKGITVKPTEAQITQSLSKYTDSTQLSQKAKEPFVIAMEKGIINGRTSKTISPKENATRAEAIVMIYRLLNVK